MGQSARPNRGSKLRGLSFYRPVGVYGDGKFDRLCLKNFEADLTRVGAKIYALQNARKLCFE